MTLSKTKRQTVYRRAVNCCEYCRLAESESPVPFHIDHIIPRKHDGTDELANLCLACFHCNTHKSHDLAGFDPSTGELTRLYHPRQQVWNEHFKIQIDMTIQGLTPEGRTTVNVLQFNDESRIETRQILHDIGDYPCVS